MNLYTKGALSVLPTNFNDLPTPYSVAEVGLVENEDNGVVDQAGTQEYMMHQYKVKLPGDATSCGIEFAGESSLATTLSPAYLQLYNFLDQRWDTIDVNNTYPEDVTFELKKEKVDFTKYRSAAADIYCRVWQLAI